MGSRSRRAQRRNDSASRLPIAYCRLPLVRYRFIGAHGSAALLRAPTQEQHGEG
jgi:hypothetical protein